MKHLDLFSGIGGFALAARWAGCETIAFCEIEPFAQAVLRKNFPGVPIHDDVTKFDGRPFRGRVDILTGGFPCQDISVAGKGAGIEGERSGLWREMLRIITECRPAIVVAENVPALRNRGADQVLSDLEAAGYTGGAFVVGADDIGATHRRKRVWIVAFAQCDDGSRRQMARRGQSPSLPSEMAHGDDSFTGASMAYNEGQRRGSGQIEVSREHPERQGPN